MGQKKKKKEFNDLLIPIILVLAVLPLVVRIISYQTGFAEYAWYSNYDVVHDFFTYYKSRIFLLLAATAGIILIPYALLHRGSLKSMKPFLFLGIYTLFAVISTVFSVNPKASLLGGYAHFESIFVLLGYILLLIYTYQIDKNEKDYQSIIRAFLISLVIMCMIGILQIFGKDPLFNTLFQKLIIPQSDWKDYVGNIKSYANNNAVALTLFNSNFASVYLSMVIPFLIVLILPGTGNQQKSSILSRWERIIIIAVIFILTILLFKTYSRTGLLSLSAVLVILMINQRKLLISRWKQCTILMLCGVLLFVGIDYFNNFRFIKKLTGTVQSFHDDQNTDKPDQILTMEQGVFLKLKGEGIYVSLKQGEADKASLAFSTANHEDITGEYDDKTMKLNRKGFENITFKIKSVEGENDILFVINGITWTFTKDDKGYSYINDNGKMDQLKQIDYVGTREWEDIGSGRGYIWSRSIPLLKNTLLIGYGPDTFLYQFPQSDYVGKANNCKTPNTLIEKPHSFYLMTGIQTGVLSLFAFLAFYFFYMLQSIHIYKHVKLSGIKERVGFGCFIATLSFMISGLFNDSSLQTTPIFIILLGLGMDINLQMEGIGKE